MVRKIRHTIFAKKTICHEILKYLLVGGVVLVAMSNPYGARMILKELRKNFSKDLSQRNVTNAFHHLKRQNLVGVESRRGETFVSLTPEGEVLAREYSFFQTERKKPPQNWDGRWSIVFFDVDIYQKQTRDALRFFLKRLGFVLLQKSVWVYPFDCRKEVSQLKNFFGLTDEEVRLVVSSDLGEMAKYKRLFGLK